MKPRSFGWLRWTALGIAALIVVACRSIAADYPTPPATAPSVQPPTATPRPALLAVQQSQVTPRPSGTPQPTPTPRPTRVTTADQLIPDTSGFGNPYLAEWDYSLTPKKDPVHRAEADAKRNWPGVTILEARVDQIAATVITLDEARRRMGERVDSATGNAPVWWVRVRGYFRYSGKGSSVADARERYLVYDGKSGDLITQWSPPAIPTPSATSCPEAFDPAQTNVHAFPPERWSPKGLLPANYALARASNGKVYTIYAGGLPDDTFQGAVVVSEGAPDPCVEAATPIQGALLVDPLRGGAVRIVQADGDLILLETTERHQIWLNFVTHQFGEIVAPGVEPPTPDPSAIGRPPVAPTPRGDMHQPRSTPVAEGTAYPFELWTHCGIDWNVDFASSFWDLDDPAWPKEGGTAYYRSDGTYVQWIGNPSQQGTMTLVDPDHAVFTCDRGTIRYRRHQGPTMQTHHCV